ncbi:ATP-binding protein [Streptomyces sp. NPDC052013]|uniref:ATP-binding protein n=1 Tax=Streptomyces sp. NPDC052013 TaxID=3365679 RepID=UPI0037D3B4C0
MTRAESAADRPGGPSIVGGSTVPVLRLPVEAAAPSPGSDSRTVGDVLRLRVAEFLTGVRPDDPVALRAWVRHDPAAGARMALRLTGQPGTVAGHEARLRDLLAGLTDLGASADTRIQGQGALTWWLSAGPARRLPRGSIAFWPPGGLRWAALLDAVDRAAGACGVCVTLTPLVPPRTAVPVLRRVVRRTAAPTAPTAPAPPIAAGAGETEAEAGPLAALEALDRALVAFHAHLLVTSDDPAVAAELAAALGAPGLFTDPVSARTRPGVLQLVRDGSIVAPQTAAGLLPLTALPGDAATRHPRRPAIVARHAPSDEQTGVWLGRSAGGRPYRLRVPDLNQHLLVTGMTGFGKSTTVMTLLRRLWREHAVPCLVIDPEKTGYLAMGTHALRLGHDGRQINPLAVPEGVNRAAFADTVAECLDAATGLSLSWPLAAAALRNAVTDLYQDDDPPTVATLYRAVVEQACGYGGTGDQAANLRASLGQRVQSLLAGAGGDALAGGPDAGLDWGRLLSEPSVITLADFGDRTARQMAFGLLLAGLVAYRRAHPLPGFGHLTVLEEAHLLLGGGTTAGPDGSRTPAAAEATATAIATQRSYGQGFVLVTQSPQQLPDTVTGLFPNLLTHRLGEPPASGAIGQVAGQVPMLGMGEAFVVTAGGHPDPVWVSVTPEPAGPAEPCAAADGPQRRTAGSEASAPSGAAERIWCQACPRPCAARHWLRLVPGVEAELAGVPQEAQGQAALAALGDRVTHENLRFTADELHAGFYCVIARALTRTRAADRRGAAAAVREARSLADRVAADTRRGAERAHDGE